MKIAEAIASTLLRDAVVVAGARGLDNEIAWVHMVDHPDIANWVTPGQLLLSTGYNWPKDDAAAERLVQALADKGLAGVVLAVPEFLAHFSPATLAVADRLGLPLLELPWHVPFSSITQEAHARIIRDQSAIIERSEAIHLALTHAAINAHSLDDLAHALARLLDRDVNFVDQDGQLLGGVDASAGRRDLERRFMQALCLTPAFRRIQDSVSPVAIEGDGALGVPRRLGSPVRIGGELVAIVWVDEGASPLAELDVRATEHASIIAALHLSHARALHLQEERLGYTFVASLLEGRFDEGPTSLQRARLNGWDPTADYRVCLILLDEPLPLPREGMIRLERYVERLRRHLKSVGEPALLFVSLNQITFLLRAHQDPDAVWKLLSSRGSAMAVSRVHRGAAGIHQGGADVASLSPLLKPGRIHHFEEVLFPRALMGDASARSLFITRKLGPLRDGARNEPLLATLAALCDEGFQLAATARRLSIHISTLRYRVERIESTLGLSLDSPGTRFEIQVAMTLMQLAEDQEPR
jgi:purine catabolism regulator